MKSTSFSSEARLRTMNKNVCRKSRSSSISAGICCASAGPDASSGRIQTKRMSVRLKLSRNTRDKCALLILTCTQAARRADRTRNDARKFAHHQDRTRRVVQRQSVHDCDRAAHPRSKGLDIVKEDV